MKKKSNTILNIIKYAVTIVFAILFVAPLLLAFINSFKTKAEISSSALALPQTWNLDNYITIITESNFVSSFMTSIFTVVVTTSLTEIWKEAGGLKGGGAEEHSMGYEESAGSF